MCCSVGMADYSTVPPPSSGSAGGGGGGGVNDAFKDALQRARQVSVDRAAASFPRAAGGVGLALLALRATACGDGVSSRGGPSRSRPSLWSWSEAPPPTRCPPAWPQGLHFRTTAPPRSAPSPVPLGPVSVCYGSMEGSGHLGHESGKEGLSR